MPTPRIHKEDKNQFHFLTFTTIEWIDIFTKPEYFIIIIDTFKYCQKNQGLLLYGFIIMTNHVHCLISAKEDYSLEDLSLIHISEPTRRTPISYAVFCL